MLGRMAMGRMMSGLSTRRYPDGLGLVGQCTVNAAPLDQQHPIDDLHRLRAPPR
jgi:hypothetical protein